MPLAQSMWFISTPRENTIAHYSGNICVSRSAAAKLRPFSLNDPSGAWKIRARELLDSATEVTELHVEP
jgi:hypothetical protein